MDKNEDRIEVDKDEKEFISILKKNSLIEITDYFTVIDEIVGVLNTSNTDGKLVFSCKSNNLNFTIGQRYIWNLWSKDKRGKFGIISLSKINDAISSELFTGKPRAHYNWFEKGIVALNGLLDIHRAIEIELNRTEKSNFLKYNNSSFEKAVFDKDYRTKIINAIYNPAEKRKITFLLVNITWNSNDWQGISNDESGHSYVRAGNIPGESWNFDFDNPRNTSELIRGYCQFTNPPKIEGTSNLLIFYSKNQIVGFYGKANVLTDAVTVNAEEVYNLVGARELCILLKNRIQNVKEKGYLEDKQRVGQIGFIYLHDDETIATIISEALLLNQDEAPKLNAISEWLNLRQTNSPKYWVFQANPTKVYRITDALKAGILKSWLVNQYKKEMQIGDKVILWVSGEEAGIYALATVTSPVHSAKVDEDEYDFFIDESKIEEDDRVNLRMDYNLINHPILKEQVLSNPNLKDLRQGTQGTNFPATKLQYDTILNLIQMDTNNQNPLNQILFGPPGTGKTYHTVTEAIKITDENYYLENYENREKLQSRFNELLIKDWKNNLGQIAFCTFHQSFSYEDFVEGIKPLAPKENESYLKYDIVAGIFKNICRLADASNNAKELAKENLVSLTQTEFNSAVFYKISLGDSTKAEDKEIYDYCINNNVISIGFGEGIDFTGKDETEVNKIVAEYKYGDYTAQAVNYFKNYLKNDNYVVVSNGNNYVRALGVVEGDYTFEPSSEIGYNHFRKVKWIFKNVEIPVSEFYQKNLSQQTIYKLKSEFIIPSFFVRKSKPSEDKNEDKKFVLIIDEINRGNVSSIFGELITLIEPTKRSGQPEALEVVLPYSKDRFTVPSNVYIIGTMNTADRSIESLDTALRRRFSFKEMAPEPELIETKGKSKGKIDDLDLVNLLQTINERIEKLIDKDHKIGHSYFLDVVTIDDLKLAFKDKVIPLLEEYFFGDFGKIGLVLGESFVKKDDSTEFKFAKFEGYDSIVEQDLRQKTIYTIKEQKEWDFSRIYN